ncbi:MAG: hypothetical protein H6509_15975 [Bryobacterales bacterium]|nr:hypothetical protein [Bryobacterales bacterium]
MPIQWPCPACGYLVFHEPPGSLQTCPVCHWIDDHIQLAHPLLRHGMNIPSLVERQHYLSDPRATPPETEPFHRDPHWKPIRPPYEPRGWFAALSERLNPSQSAAPLPEGWEEERLSRLIRKRHIPLLLWMRRDPAPAIASRAEQALREILSGMSAKEAVRFDDGMRSRLSDYRGSGWPADLLPDDMPADLLAALRASHPNGYVRKAAVRALSQMTSGFELPFLTLRVNDWVEQVRTPAMEAVDRRLQADYAEPLVRNLGLLTWLESTERHQHHAWVSQVRDRLQTPPFTPALLAGLDSSDPTVRRSAFEILSSSPSAPMLFVARLGLSSRDPMLRVRAARLAAAHYDEPGFSKVVQEMRTSRFSPVRRTAFDALLAGPHTAALVEAALGDRNAAIRALARKSAAESGIDLRHWYADRLDAGSARNLVPIIAGLGEVGAKEQEATLTGYLSHPLPSVRRATLGALSSLGYSDVVSVALSSLSDQSGSVSRRALGILRRRPAAVDPSKVWHVFTSAAALHARRNALLLLAAKDKWVSAPFLVRAGGDPDLADTSLQLLRAWGEKFNASFTVPTAQQLDDLDAALTECGNNLPRAIRQPLQFLVRSTR